MKILETERTILREITIDDAEFILKLLNEPSFIRYIGDRNLRTAAEAGEYIATRFAASYRQNGFGLYLVELKKEFGGGDSIPIGINGFVKRVSLPDADIGFAFLSEFERQGFAFETASAVMRYGGDVLHLEKVLAITSPDNESSERLLKKLGFAFDGLIKIAPENEELKLFSVNLPTDN